MGLTSLFLAVALSASNPSPHYNIDLTLDPTASRWSLRLDAAGIRCRGQITRLYLHRDIVLQEALIDGKPVSPVFDPPSAAPFWIKATRAIDLPCPKKKLTLRYDGPGRLHKDGHNQVSPELIELSLYGGWYPLTSLDDRFTWTLKTSLPAHWQFSTPTGARETLVGSQRQLVIRSTIPEDVVLLASPRFLVQSVATSGVTMRVFVSNATSTAERARAIELGKDGAGMTAWLQDLFGPARKGPLVRPDVVFTPRGGSLSYSRLPLIVLREQTLREVSYRDARLNMRHEVAHFWSRAKGASNDWINEGLAEYLAIMRTGDVEGPDVRAITLAKYRAVASAAGAGEPIVTAGDDERGYLNRYVRPALMLDAAERQAGRARMKTFLQQFVALGARQDSAAFSRLASEVLGPEVGATVSRCLASRDWPTACGGM